MNKNTNNSDRNIPEAVLELVPWYAIGNLSVDDQAIFDKALETYPSLQQYIEQEKQIIQSVSADHSLLVKSAIASTDERLKSVLNMIDVEEKQTQNSVQSDSESMFDKLRNALSTLIPTSNGEPQYARVASVGVLVLSVAVLTAFVAPLFTDKSDYVPASAISQAKDDQKVALTKSSNTVLLVGFKGTSVELGENDVLKDKLLKIESVPEKEDMFQIQFKEVMSAEEIKQTIDALTAQKETIWFAGEAY